MKATIQNYRGVASATLDLTKIALVAGGNGAGKSSVCQALAAALTGDPVPLPGVKKTSAGVLVRSGTAAGKIELASANGSSEITWPAAKVKTTGQAPCASEFATGLNSIVTMPEKERVPFLIQYLKAQPTKENLEEALAPLQLGDIMVDRLWELITTQGWDGAYAQIKEKGAKLKGQWEQVTNDNYGAKKADSWIPEGWETDLEGASEDNLKAMVTDARDALEAAIASAAVDLSERAKLEALAALLPERETALADVRTPLLENQALKVANIDLTAALQDLGKEQAALEKIRAAEPKAGKEPEKYPCPCCGKDLMVTANGLAEWAVTGPSENELRLHKSKFVTQEKVVDRVQKRIPDLEAKVKELSVENAKALQLREQAIFKATELANESRRAQQELAKTPAAQQGSGDVDQCRNDLAAHERRLKAFVSKRDAYRLHASIVMNQELLTHIAPGGVRAEVLQRALGVFNDVMGNLSLIAKWPQVTIEQDFSFSLGGTPYFLLSESEKWRVRTIAQVAMAGNEQAAVVICDGADILDKCGRNGLFKLLVSAGIPALVGMTIDQRDQVPNLAAAGYGVSYWIHGAAVQEV